MPLSKQLKRLALCAVMLCAAVQVQAGPREQALQIHSRVAGVPPSEPVLLQMAEHIDSGDVAAAVRMAMENDSFYRATLKTLATPWTNRDMTPFAPLNDYTATV